MSTYELITENGILKKCVGEAVNLCIPQGITEIGADALKGQIRLESVALPTTLERISDCAFAACYALKNIYIRKGVKHIGKRAFNGCFAMKWVLFEGDSELEVIDDQAFLLCQKLSVVELPPSVRKIGKSAFHLSPLNLIFIPSPKISLSVYALPYATITEFPNISPKSLPEALRLNAVRGYFSMKRRGYPLRKSVEKRYLEYIKATIPDITCFLQDFPGNLEERRSMIAQLCTAVPLSNYELSALAEVCAEDAELISLIINTSKGNASTLDGINL